MQNLTKLLTFVLIATGMAACSNDDEPKWDDTDSKVELPAQRMFVLNQGIWNSNNATLSLINPDIPSQSIDDIFQLQNGVRLGDTGQQVVEEDGEMFVAMATSNYLLKLNSAAVEEGRLSFVNDPDLTAGIRYIAAEDGYVFATFYGGYLLKINARTMTIDKKVKTPAANLEGIAIADDKIYVSDAYEMVYGQGSGSGYVYHDQVLVYSARDLSQLATVTVGVNPNKIVEEDDRLFVMCLGNYADKGYTAYMIDADNGNKVTLIGDSTEVATYDDKAFFVNSITDWLTYTTTNTFFSYDIKTGRTDNSSFLKGAPAELSSATISMVSINPDNGDIFIGVSYYASSNGDLYRFDRLGNYLGKLSSGGQHPVSAVYFD